MRTIPSGLLLDFGGVITYSLFEKHRDTEAILKLPQHSQNSSAESVYRAPPR